MIINSVGLQPDGIIALQDSALAKIYLKFRLKPPLCIIM